MNATPNKNDGAERLAIAPYYTNYFQKMLDLSPSLEQELAKKSIIGENLSPKSKPIEYTKEEYASLNWKIEGYVIWLLLKIWRMLSFLQRQESIHG